jgi:hypothetical protein
MAVLVEEVENVISVWLDIIRSKSNRTEEKAFVARTQPRQG